ncbi:MAG: shikimate 5-dehydrogenase [Acidocella sp. 20-63-7]|nr:MAG: shikimate 5-dehydrogenase [Acidocella sp. 20-63-7]HQT47046.1 shikimate 5-dehydrogenase [Acidocella sp.]
MKPPIGRDTRLCMSLSARPSNFGSRFHNHLYEALGLDYVYKAFRIEDIAGAIAGVRALGVRGCAISMPFKEAVIPLLDVMEASAKAIDSINTIVNDDGRLTGYNTDYTAVRTLIEQLGVEPAEIDRRGGFILRGSGGMAKAVAAALRDTGFRRGMIFARNARTGPELAASYGFEWQPELGNRVAPFLLNASPLGMAGADQDVLAFAQDRIGASEIVFDMVALPLETPMLTKARELGKRVITGGDVGVLQALEQFVLYTGIRPSAAQVDAAAGFARTP